MSSLFRRGTFEKMMKRDAENMKAADHDIMYGRLLHSRIKKADKLPTQCKVEFLPSVNTTGDVEAWSATSVNNAFSWCLMIGPQTPLPPHDLFKHETPLKHACIFHYPKKAPPPPMDFDLTETPSLEKIDFFRLADDGTVTFLPLKKEFKLPGGADMQWQLTGASDMENLAKSAKNKGFRT